MPTARVRDVDLYYETAGDGPPLLFVSGTGGDLRRGPTVLDSLLPRHFTVLAYDQRGLGRSGKPDEPYSMAGYAEDAAGLLDHVGWADCHVVGVSFGGMVAQELAIRHPGRVRRLVLACTSSGGPGGASYPLHELAGLPVRERARRHLAVSDTRVDPATAPDALVDQVVERLTFAADEPGHDVGARRQLEARARHDTYDRLHRITAPTLVCGGRFDGIAAPANQESLAAAIPGAALRWFDGGHLFLLQDRAAYPAIVEFLLAAS